jgi:hypothetical protein
LPAPCKTTRVRAQYQIPNGWRAAHVGLVPGEWESKYKVCNVCRIVQLLHSPCLPYTFTTLMCVNWKSYITSSKLPLIQSKWSALPCVKNTFRSIVMSLWLKQKSLRDV